MSGLVIKGCEYDPIESRDVVYGDGFRMDLEQAIAWVEQSYVTPTASVVTNLPCKPPRGGGLC